MFNFINKIVSFPTPIPPHVQTLIQYNTLKSLGHKIVYDSFSLILYCTILKILVFDRFNYRQRGKSGDKVSLNKYHLSIILLHSPDLLLLKLFLDNHHIIMEVDVLGLRILSTQLTVLHSLLFHLVYCL